MAPAATKKKIDPEDYILSVLSPEDRLDAAFKVAGEAFKKTRLTCQGGPSLKEGLFIYAETPKIPWFSNAA